MNLSQLLDTEILRTQQELGENIVASGQRATGRTIAALRSESAPELGRLLGPAHIGVLEEGSAPARDPNAKPGRAMVDDIRLWLEARGLGLNPWAVATSILRKGTRLHRGQDPRFGRPTGTLRDVLAASRARLRQGIAAETRRSISSELFADFASKTAY
ncbi:hypothetical protein D0N36_06875 [Hymenobacter lapidiphilus]|uniref:hypothetical protein n=1 Tax=Hymenobacter sp. CCM 8763 TaxID=2303334 RepID=UPI000E34798E|nr:hypothetical protein [Hymenobacter sp. CCM 8763]RFP65921.1 hypothetical protein D0N36_06875 [Hymenobacter sp. CCM 8763]